MQRPPGQSQRPWAEREDQWSSKTTFCKIFEAREFTTKGEAYDTRRAIALFGDVDLSDALLRAILRIVHVIAIDQGDYVGILFDGPGFAQIGQLRFRWFALFDRPAQLR